MIRGLQRLQATGEEIVRNGWFLLRQHRSVTIATFAGSAALLLTVGTFSPKRYAGTAVVALNVPSASAGPSSDQSTESSVQQQKAHVDWSAIASANHLPPQAGNALASQVSIEALTAAPLAGSVRIRFIGTDRDAVFGVTDAVAEQLTRPLPRLAPTPPDHSDGLLYAPVILPEISSPATEGRGGVPHESSAALNRRLEASLYQGKKIQEALNQNALALDGLHDEWNERERKGHAVNPLPAPLPKPAVAKQVNPQEEHLRQDLLKAERDLASLRERYTEEYPGVVSARDKVHDIQLDLTRLGTAAPVHAAAAKPQPTPETRRPANVESSLIPRQIAELESVQGRMQEALNRNHAETLRLQKALAALGSSQPPVEPKQAAMSQPSTDSAILPAPALANDLPVNDHPAAAPVLSSRSTVSPFFLVEHASVRTIPWFFAAQVLWPFSLVFAAIAAVVAAWLAEWRDPSIRNEGMLRHELPASAVYLGRIPRIRHEVIAD